MLKKINQYLLTHFPLVWNLKLIWILPIALLVNFIAFLQGLTLIKQINEITSLRIESEFLENYLGIYYFFGIIIILIIWLYFYIKNNRFKSSYPTSKWYLLKEFLGVFSIIFLFILVPNSYASGLNFRVANLLSDKQFEEEADLINRIYPFTLQSSSGYSSYSRNLSVPVFDDLVTENAVKVAYEKNVKLKKDSISTNRLKFLTPYFRNPEYEVLLDSVFRNEQLTYGLFINRVYFAYDDIEVENNYDAYYNFYEDRLSYNQYYAVINSLYNFSQIVIPLKGKDQKYYDKELIILLQNNDIKTIEDMMAKTLKILDRYKIGYRFRDNKWTTYIDRPPYYFLTEELSSQTRENDKGRYQEKDYINISTLVNYYTKIEKAKHEYNYVAYLHFYVNTALFIALVLITFRLSSFRVWIISLVSFGIMCLLSIFLHFILGELHISFYNEFIFPILIYLIVITCVFLGLKNKRYKLFTGILLNWFTVATSFIFIMMISCYKELRYDWYFYNTVKDKSYYEIANYPEIETLNQLIESFLYYNPILYILIFIGCIIMYRKWQAMPEN